jgi:hypothetical protein
VRWVLGFGFRRRPRAPKSGSEGSEALCVLIQEEVRSPQRMDRNLGSVPKTIEIRRSPGWDAGGAWFVLFESGWRVAGGLIWRWFPCMVGAFRRKPKACLGSEYDKGIRWMPWHQEAMKDVARCEKPWGAASRL